METERSRRDRCIRSSVDLAQRLWNVWQRRIGVRDTFGESGPAKDLLHKYELDAEGIYKQIKAAL